MSEYRILGKIAEGGMGTVFRALQVDLDREVALKTLLPTLAQNELVATRFRREVKMLCHLSHPNIVPIFDEGVLAGRPYFVMELVEGPPVDEVLKEAGRLPFDEVLALSVQLADAMKYLHERGVHHRDIKPKNLIVTEKGGKKHLILVDFGLARGASALTLTAPGEIVGTLPFLAPELLDEKEGGAPQDIWAIGATLFQLAANEMLFPGGQPAVLIASILNFDAADLPARLPGTPLWFVDVLAACLTRDPERRITAGELHRRLENPPPSAESMLAAAAATTHIPMRMPSPAIDTTKTGVPEVTDALFDDPWGDTPSTEQLQRLLPGTRFVKLLGQGGMGIVYEGARDPSGERVAIKMILPRMLSHPDALARFKRESSILLRIFSPRVVRLLDHGERDGWHYLVMEYLEGQDLRSRLSDRGPLGYDEGMTLLTGVAEGLAALHAHSVVHRDIKPANVFLTRNGPKILDMGLSRQLDVTGMTTDGAYLGTPIYSPPELLAQLPVESPGDIYQFGALVFETFTARQTFRRKDATTELTQALHAAGADELAILKVTKVFEHCMRADPAHRYPGGAALLLALQQDAGHSRLPDPRAKKQPSGQVPASKAGPPRTAPAPVPAEPAPTGVVAAGGKLVKGLFWAMLLLMTVAAAITLAVLPEILRRSGV